MSGIGDIQIAWAAGLFEGEGCFTKAGSTPKVALSMTDRDVVERYGSVIGVGKLTGPYRTSKGNKPVWYWNVHGILEFERIVRLFWPYLGVRRREKAMELIEWAAARPGRGWWGNSEGHSLARTVSRES